MSRQILVNTVSLSGGSLTREHHIVRRISEATDKYEYDVLCTPASQSELGDLPNATLHTVNEPDSAVDRILWENTGLLNYVRKLDPDILYFPLHLTNFVDLCPKVSAVRNIAPFYPEAHAGAPIAERVRLHVLREVTKRTIHQSEKVVFMTHSTQERVAKHIPAAKKKGVVVPHGIPDGFEPIGETEEIYETYDLPETFLLCVSNVSRYKNLRELVEGYAIAREDSDIPRLCLAGKVVDDKYAEEVHECIERHGLSEHIHYLGFVPHDDLPKLHAACDGFVFSSACENAPISLIEALACGDAIATSSAASMPEICDGAAVYFDPYDTNDIGETLAEFWRDADKRARLRKQARNRAKELSWTTAAQKTNKLFNTVFRNS